MSGWNGGAVDSDLRLKPARLWRGDPPEAPGPFHVNMNDFWVRRHYDIPRVVVRGMLFRRNWPMIEGALSVWFAAYNHGHRQVSVSVWRSPEDLKEFVRSPEHQIVMKEFGNAGVQYTNTWSTPTADRHHVWQQAEDRLMGRVPGVPHH